MVVRYQWHGSNNGVCSSSIDIATMFAAVQYSIHDFQCVVLFDIEKEFSSIPTGLDIFIPFHLYLIFTFHSTCHFDFDRFLKRFTQGTRLMGVDRFSQLGGLMIDSMAFGHSKGKGAEGGKKLWLTGGISY